MMDDSPLLTPEGPDLQRQKKQKQQQKKRARSEDDSPLLTPEDQRRPPKAKKTTSKEVLAPELSRTESGLSLQRIDSTISLGSAAQASAEKYRRIEKVGVGAYGNVFKAENMETKEIVAIKATIRKEDPVYGGFPLSLLREVCILRRVRHESIVKIHEVAQTPKGDPLIVMEFCQASLLELISSQKHDLSFSEIKYITRQLLDATHHLHMHGILHRDLATKNVLFNLSGEIKICDFGISRMGFGQDEEFGFIPAPDLEDPNMIVSLPYRAIELLLGDRNYGPALDVWSVGCIFAEVMLYRSGRRLPLFAGSLERPNKTPEMYVEEIFHIMGKPCNETWPGVQRLPLYKTFNSGRIANARSQENPGDEKAFVRHFFLHGDGKRANQKYCLTDSCFELLAGLLTLCPAQRITAADALQLNFFTKEKPVPQWHAWHWNMEKGDDIKRGDEMRKSRNETDEAKLMKQLSREEVGGSLIGRSDSGGGEGGGGDGKSTNRVLERLRSQAEARQAQAAQKQQEAAKALQRSKSAPVGPSNSKDALPPGWSKHWSNSKQRHYYHHAKSGKNSWEVPKR